MEQYVMALDQGTTSSRCILFNKSGHIVSMAQKEFEQIYPKPGWVEHNPLDLWASQLAVAIEAMVTQGVKPENICGIGITNQRETTIVWDKITGEPVYNAIVWQCRRTAPMIDQLKKDGMEEKILEKTGLIPDAYFSATKIAWILEQVPGAREKAEKGELLFGTVDTWLVYNLTKGKLHITDYTNASRTMLFDIKNRCWDKELMDYFNIPESMLPKVCPSSQIYGEVDTRVFGAPIPIAGIAGDQQAALFGQCCFQPGDTKNTYGTGCFLLMNTGNRPIRSKSGLITTIAATQEGTIEYALEGSVFVAGAAIQWLRDGLRMIKSAAQSEEYTVETRDTGGVYVVPSFAGMGAPYWNPYARGSIYGITRGCTKEHFITATLESIAYQTVDILKAIEEDSGIALTGLKVDGGASANDFLMQFQSDILNTEVQRPKSIETTALGAAYLAGLATGYWKNKEEIVENWQMGHKFSPNMPEDVREKKLKGWKRAVKATLLWADEE
ncbi:MAG: glycerol kinase GlpK [Lachnospiraceae bacterium]